VLADFLHALRGGADSVVCRSGWVGDKKGLSAAFLLLRDSVCADGRDGHVAVRDEGEAVGIISRRFAQTNADQAEVASNTRINTNLS
jgi:hypothetical protein